MDIVLVLILLFGERFMGRMVGADGPDGNFDLEKVDSLGAYLLLGGFILALPTFFLGPKDHPHQIIGFFPLAAVWISATAITLMGITGAMILANNQSTDPYTENVPTSELVFAISLFACIVVLPIILTIIYTKRVRKKKIMSATIRSLMLIPLIFFSTAYVNFIINNPDATEMSFFTMYLLFSVIFIPYYMAPRWFALGDDPKANSFRNWFIRYTLFVLVMYFQI